MDKIPGSRKQPSGDWEDGPQSDFPSAAKGISEPEVTLTMVLITMISGNTILLPMHGHRKLTSGEEQGSVQPDFPSAAKGISEPEVTMVLTTMISGNTTLLPMHGHR